MRNIKQFLIFTTCLLLILTTCVGCNKYPNEPFNGEVEFGDITITIPDTYIRDTTVQGYKEGVAKRWERDNYKSIVTISRHEKYELTDETMQQIVYNQQTQMAVGTVQAEKITFFDKVALQTTFEIEDEQEMKYLIFSDNEYTYEFSVQGDISDYETIKSSIRSN